MVREKGAYAPVFYPSLCLTLLLAIIGILWPEEANIFFSALQNWLLDKVGWIYILGMAIFVCLSIFLMVSRLGDIRLGPDHSKAEYSNLSWFAMLFAAGMGIGLMFFSVAEPLQHFISPPMAESGTTEAARNAMNITFFHWGLEAWGVYAIVGLALAYFSYRHDLPLLPRSALYPLLKDKIYGPIGHVIDIFAIIGTMFGIATSLGFGATQVNAGLNFLFAVPDTSLVKCLLIVIITSIATISVALGLDKGIKVLSNFNIIIALFLLLFVLLFGDTTGLLRSFVQNTGNYLSSIVQKTFNLYAYEHKQGWLSGWTLFYWGWWIAWSPFVGMFIARVSKGRTIREFMIGVLFIPTGFTFLWLTVFGNSAINIAIQGSAAGLLSSAESNVPVALFQFLQHFPFSMVISIISLILIVTFFVTSADSGSLVIDILATRGAKKSIVWQRIFWSLLEGFLAISLLYSGGLAALQTATIASAFPFLIILFFICIALVKALSKDYLKLKSIQNHVSNVQYTKSHITWEQRVDQLLDFPNEEQVISFLTNTTKPALEKLFQKFKQKQAQVSLDITEKKLRFVINIENDKDFIYGIYIQEHNMPEHTQNKKNMYYFRAEVFLEHGGQHYDIMGFTEDQVIADVITQYEKHLHYLHLTSLD
ncbi:BCCT family transporter [Francisellaceae bacterium]|nr:BCCT family transporter [Francisellaceae bacterium]